MTSSRGNQQRALAILFLCVRVLIRVGARQGLSAAPFIAAADFKAWSGIGYALVFCVLSFAGFEGAAQLRRIEDEETRFALADLNADGYGVPNDWGRQALGSAALWRGPLFGRIAYIGGKPVSGAFALPIDKALYIGWAATSKAYRGLGLAELVIRTCLEDARKATGFERTRKAPRHGRYED